MSEIKMPPNLYMGTRLVPYEQRTFRTAAFRESLGYTNDPKEFYSTETVKKIVAERDAEIEALRAEAERQKEWLVWWGKFASRQSTHAEQAEARAERLAEALREAYGQVRELCDAHVHPYPEASFARYEAALRDHDQEGKDG